MLLLTKDLERGKILTPSPQSLNEISKFNLESPFDKPLQKPVCINSMVFFENVTEEDLASKPQHTFFVNSSSDTSPIILIPSNSSVSDILNRNKLLEEQATNLEGIIIAEQRDKKAKSTLNRIEVSKKKEKKPIKAENRTLSNVLPTKLQEQGNKVSTSQNTATPLEINVTALQGETQELKATVTTLQTTVTTLQSENQELKATISNLQTIVAPLLEDQSFLKIVNTARAGCEKLGLMLEDIFENGDWMENIEDLKKGVKEKTIITSVAGISLAQLKQGIRLFRYWNKNCRVRNNHAHPVLSIEEIKNNPSNDLFQFLDILEKVLKN